MAFKISTILPGIISSQKTKVETSIIEKAKNFLKKNGIDLSGISEKDIKGILEKNKINFSDIANGLTKEIEGKISDIKKMADKIKESVKKVSDTNVGTFIDDIFKKCSTELIDTHVVQHINKQIEKITGLKDIKLEKIAGLDSDVKNKISQTIKGTYRVLGLDKSIKTKMETEVTNFLNKSFKDYIDPLTSKITNIDIASQALKPLNKIQTRINDLTKKITDKLSSIEKLDIAKKLTDSVLGKINLDNIAGGKLKQYADKILNSSALKKINSMITSTITSKISPLVTKAVNVMKKVNDAIKNVKETIVKYQNMIKNAIKQFTDKIKSFVTEQAQKFIGSIASSIGSSISFSF